MAVVRFIAIRAPWEEELLVDLLSVLLELFLEDMVGLIALLSFECVGDFSAMGGGDEPISNRADCLVEIWLSGEDVDRGLR
jgi:hypothetical protein